jgi:hypothetical protein
VPWLSLTGSSAEYAGAEQPPRAPITIAGSVVKLRMERMMMSPPVVNAQARSKHRARVARWDPLGTTNGFRNRAARLHRVRKRLSSIAGRCSSVRERRSSDGDALRISTRDIGVPAYLQTVGSSGHPLRPIRIAGATCMTCSR